MITDQSEAATATRPARVPVVVTLIDGTVVDDHDPRWLAECQTRQRHIESLRMRDRMTRTEYIANVARSEGDEAGRRLAAAYVVDWQRRKAGVIAPTSR